MRRTILLHDLELWSSRVPPMKIGGTLVWYPCVSVHDIRAYNTISVRRNWNMNNVDGRKRTTLRVSALVLTLSSEANRTKKLELVRWNLYCLNGRSWFYLVMAICGLVIMHECPKYQRYSSIQGSEKSQGSDTSDLRQSEFVGTRDTSMERGSISRWILSRSFYVIPGYDNHLGERELEGKWIMRNEMRMISKDGKIYEFPGYISSKEEEDEEEEVEEEEEEDEEEEEE
ncbi:hypothetical protein Tco_0236063 [Tanacetum coccineum]